MLPGLRLIITKHGVGGLDIHAQSHNKHKETFSLRHNANHHMNITINIRKEHWEFEWLPQPNAFNHLTNFSHSLTGFWSQSHTCVDFIVVLYVPRLLFYDYFFHYLFQVSIPYKLIWCSVSSCCVALRRVRTLGIVYGLSSSLFLDFVLFRLCSKKCFRFCICHHCASCHQ